MQIYHHTSNDTGKSSANTRESASTTRGLLMFGPRTCADLVVNAIERFGWEPCIVSDVTEARRLDEESAFKVGVVLLESEEELTQSRQLVSALPHIKWIAVLPREIAEHDPILFFIAEHIHDFQHFPIDPVRLSVVLGHAYGMAALEDKSRRRKDRVPAASHGMIGNSRAMKQLYLDVERAAGSDAPVLIVGETGTGKEMVGRAIHSSSARAKGPFVVFNCAAVPVSLMHSELFGHERGAFTHAFDRRIGRLESADGGTLLLDEIGELPEETQAILLRFLEEKSVTRLGGTNPIPVNVRIIAATNRDLEQCVHEKSFRQDLFYRLAVLVVKTPALRARGDDIEPLARHFLSESISAGGLGRLGFAPEAIVAMRRYTWPGNLRELRSRIIQAAFQAEDRLITERDLGLPQAGAKDAIAAQSLQEARDMAERDTLQVALRHNEGNVSRTAKQLRISRMTLYRLLEKHHIRVER